MDETSGKAMLSEGCAKNCRNRRSPRLARNRQALVLHRAGRTVSSQGHRYGEHGGAPEVSEGFAVRAGRVQEEEEERGGGNSDPERAPRHVVDLHPRAHRRLLSPVVTRKLEERVETSRAANRECAGHAEPPERDRHAQVILEIQVPHYAILARAMRGKRDPNGFARATTTTGQTGCPSKGRHQREPPTGNPPRPRRRHRRGRPGHGTA